MLVRILDYSTPVPLLLSVITLFQYLCWLSLITLHLYLQYVPVSLYLYLCTCISAAVFLYMYLCTCISVTVSLYLYLCCLSLLSYVASCWRNPRLGWTSLLFLMYCRAWGTELCNCDVTNRAVTSRTGSWRHWRPHSFFLVKVNVENDSGYFINDNYGHVGDDIMACRGWYNDMSGMI